MEYTFGTIADIPALIDMRTAYILEDFGELSPEDGLDYVNLSATKAGYPVYQKVGFSERQSHYTEMQIR